MFGDYLRNSINLLTEAEEKRASSNNFYCILKQIAIMDILGVYPHKVDSDIAVPIYYEILHENEYKLPKYYCETLKSNNQKRYRVICRNLFTSNAYHKDGLANQKEINAVKTLNESKKGNKIIYQGVVEYVNKSRNN